jgi:hypothetical protein
MAILGGKPSYERRDAAVSPQQPTCYADTTKGTLWSILVSVTNWYNLADDGDDGSLVDCRWSIAAGRGRRSQLRTVGSQCIKYLRTGY